MHSIRFDRAAADAGDGMESPRHSRDAVLGNPSVAAAGDVRASRHGKPSTAENTASRAHADSTRQSVTGATSCVTDFKRAAGCRSPNERERTARSSARERACPTAHGGEFQLPPAHRLPAWRQDRRGHGAAGVWKSQDSAIRSSERCGSRNRCHSRPMRRRAGSIELDFRP